MTRYKKYAVLRWVRMKEIVCPHCGSSEFVMKGNYAQCLFCGTKYGISERNINQTSALDIEKYKNLAESYFSVS